MNKPHINMYYFGVVSSIIKKNIKVIVIAISLMENI